MERLPRGLRNNNPGNIEDGSFAKSIPGYVGSDGRFAVFDSLNSGAHAMQKLLSGYGKRGIDTVDGVINRWAPPTENDTGAYAATVASHLGVKPGDKIDLNDPQTLAGLSSAMAGVENGHPIQLGYVDPQVDAPNSAAGAVNSMAAGTLGGVAPHLVQSVGFVPPPMSGQQGNFQPLFANPSQQAAPQGEPGPVESKPLAPPQPEESDDDILKSFMPSSPEASAAGQNDAQPKEESDDDILNSFMPKEAPKTTLEASQTAAPAKQDTSTIGDVIRSGASGVARGALDLVGLPATIQNAFDNSLSAITGIKAPPPSPLSGNSLRDIASKASDGATDYAAKTTAGKYAGTIGEFLPGAVALPGENLLASAVKYGAIPGAASEAAGQLTSGTAAEPWARLGGALLAPTALEGGIRGAELAGNTVAKMAPKGAAATNILASLKSSGTNPDEISNALTTNPRLSPMDTDTGLQQMAMNLANQGGEPRAILDKAVNTRIAGAKDSVNGAFDEAAGQTPDTVQMLDDLRARQQASEKTPTDVKALLDQHISPATDPHTAVKDFIGQRTTQSGPAYETAMQGGSMAPLQQQFEGAFSDATSAVSQASKDLAAAQQKQLLAAAETSRAGNNVYASSGANAATKEAQTAVDEAHNNLSAATAQKESVLGRLRQAQADGTANAPGAVWSPRIQQFLDEPIIQEGLAKGAKIQRLESLADNKPFNPSEYAITGADEAGNPIVGSVPNMRTLNVVKKGLDRMVEDSKNEFGKVSEEGRAIDGVRRSFLAELDKANPDYQIAREAWGGPSKVMDAFKKGMGLFQNTAGMGGIDNTPAAIASFVKTASPDELQGLKMGARASLEHSMNTSGDQVDKVTRLANIEANQKKLAAIIGDGPAKEIVDGLNAQHQDPIGEAFNRGMDILRNRSGSAGLEDRPEFLQQWVDGASPHELEAAKQGARVAVDNQINSVRSAAAKGAAIPEVGFNKARLEALLGKDETAKLAKTLSDEQKIASTNAKLFAGSQTAPRQAANKLTEVTKVTPGFNVGPGALGAAGGALAYGMGSPLGALGSVAAGGAISGLKMGTQALMRSRDLARNRLLANALSGDATTFADAIHPSNSTNRLAIAMSKAKSPELMGYIRTPISAASNALSEPRGRK